MLLLILGYYNPILKVFTENLLRGQNAGKSILILGSCGLGIAIGFFTISIIMKLLLKHCQRGTYFAIVGFIVGSLPTVFVSTAKEAGMTLSTLPESFIHWLCCVLLLATGVALSLLFVKACKKRANK